MSNAPLPSPENGSFALYSEIARRIQPRMTLKGAYDRALFIARSYMGRPHSDVWYRWLRTPLMAPLSEANPYLFKKVTRPYFTPKWTKAQKIDAIRAHYEFLAQHVPQNVIVAASTVPGHNLLSFAGKGGELFSVALQSESKFNKEGELTLALYSTQHNIRVYTVSILITAHAGDPDVMLIGATQGLEEGAEKDTIKDVAKALHGLRPKALLVYVAQELAQAWGARAIRAVSNDLHMSNHSDYRFNKSRRPHLNYDEFWTECDGTKRADGFFEIPLRHVPRSRDEIKPNKRSQYNQRYAMMDALALDLKTAVAALKAQIPQA